MTLLLRAVAASDLSAIFRLHQDPAANQRAAFTNPDSTDRPAFMAKWARLLADEEVHKQAIVLDEGLVGYLVSFVRDGRREVGYWLGREHWGQGLATKALTAFLGHVTTRPLHAVVAADNLASLRVLEKCGFSVVGRGRSFAHARGADVEETVLVLE